MSVLPEEDIDDLPRFTRSEFHLRRQQPEASRW